MTAVLYRVGGAFLRTAEVLGGMATITARVLACVVHPDLDGRETWRTLYKVGVKSIPIVVLTAFFTGAIMVIQAALYVRRFQAYGMLGWGAGYAILREVGPVLIGLMFSGRVGANNTAELATMTVTDQVNALRALAIDPFNYLIMPRVIAMVVMLFCLTVVGDLLALIGGAIAAQLLVGVEPRLFYQSLVEFIHLHDLTHGLVKAAAFGVVIGIVSCHFGLSVRGGAQGVGRAVNASVVASAVAIFILDYFLTFLMK